MGVSGVEASAASRRQPQPTIVSSSAPEHRLGGGVPYEDRELPETAMVSTPTGKAKSSQRGAADADPFGTRFMPRRGSRSGGAAAGTVRIIHRKTCRAHPVFGHHVDNLAVPFDLGERRSNGGLEILQGKPRRAEDVESHRPCHGCAAAAVEGREAPGVPPSIRRPLAEGRVQRVAPAGSHDSIDGGVVVLAVPFGHAW